MVRSYFSLPVPHLIAFSIPALAGLAAWRTRDALLILAAFAPIATAVQSSVGAPYSGYALLEVWILAVFCGAALRAGVLATPVVVTAFDALALVFAAIALASGLAQMPTALLYAGPAETVSAVLDVVWRHYFDRPMVVVWETTLLMEGALLAALIARTLAVPGAAAQLRNMAIAGGAAAAALNMNRVVEVVLRSGSPAEGLRIVAAHLRFDTQYADLNAAGSYFALLATVCSVDAGFRNRRQWTHSLLCVLFAGAMWTAGSRVALAAAVLSTAVALGFRSGGLLRNVVRSRIRVAAAGTVAVVVFVGALLLLSVTRRASFEYAVYTRVELLKVGMRMLRDHPLLGAGTSQFYTSFPRYVSPELAQRFERETGAPVLRENAHNQFMQIAAELGVAGLACFVTLLALALRPARTGGMEWRSGIVAGLAAFLVTCTAGHPLLTPLVAHSFWIILGLAASGAARLRAGAERATARTAAVVTSLLLVTLPVRWDYERRSANLDGITFGFSVWETDESGARFRWAGRQSTFFVSLGAGAVRLRLRSGDGSPVRVSFRLDGKPAGEIALPDGRWLETLLVLPRSRRAPAFRRVDLEVVSGAPAEPRMLRVGRIDVMSR